MNDYDLWPGGFQRAMSDTARRFHALYGQCICGADKDDLVAFFGPGIAIPGDGGHIQTCPDCRGDLHVTDGSQECMVCGRWSGVDAEGDIARGQRPPKRGYLPQSHDYTAHGAELARLERAQAGEEGGR